MSRSIGSVENNISRISEGKPSPYDAFLLEAMEAKLYYLRDTTSPVEFDDLVNAEVERLKQTLRVEPRISFEDLIKVLKLKICKKFKWPETCHQFIQAFYLCVR